MNDEPHTGNTIVLKTSGVGTFGETETGSSKERLFRVEPGHDANDVMAQLSLLMNCVYKLTRRASIERDDTLVYAAYALSGMANALIDDVAHGLFLRNDIEDSCRPCRGAESL